MIRVVLPYHLRTLARVDGEVTLDVEGQVTQRSVLDALEAQLSDAAGDDPRSRARNGGGRWCGSSPAGRISPTSRRTPRCRTR